MLLFGAIALVSLSGNTVVNAEEYMTEEQIEMVTEGLDDNAYVLPTPEGGFITKADGSNDFHPEQITISGQQPMTVAEYKEYLKTFDISFENYPEVPISPFRAASPPTNNIRVLRTDEFYYSNPFSASGWRYGEIKFLPAGGTGDYLFWEAYIDSGIVEDGKGVAVEVYPGNGQYVYSLRGTYFKTWNPARGAFYKVSNPV
ncbi:hypothetical protein [Streptococcus merionis]|uniref:hypothetical protein n=1 Tax=Streptococcus merionis TaxID=400065 RepID=UPI003517F070